MRSSKLLLALLFATSQLFGVEKFLLNPAPDEDYLIKINDGGVIKDLMRFDADINKVIVDGDLEATGTTTGFTAASAAPDWLTATDYGIDEIVVDPNSGITYRANNAHTSAGTNLTDNAGDYDIIGSASNGVIKEQWETLALTSTQVTNATTTGKGLRDGSSLKVRGYRVYTGATNAANNDFILPAGYTIDTSRLPVGVADADIIGHWKAIDNGVEFYSGVIVFFNTTTVLLKYDGVFASSTVDHDTPFTFGNTDHIVAEYEVPILEWNNSGVTVSIQDLTEQTTAFTMAISSTPPGWSASRSTATVFKDTDDNYYAEIDIHATFTVLNGAQSITLDDLTFANSNGNQLIVNGTVSGVSIEGRTTGTNVLNWNSNAQNINNLTLGGRIPVLKPSWFDANRENPASVSAFVPEATASQAGIVGIGVQTFAGAKTFTGDLTATGSTTGFTAASAAPDWLTATDYGIDEIVVDPNSGITYRANNAHTSAGTNLTDNAGDYDVIGSASNGFIGGTWETYVPASTSNFPTGKTITFRKRRSGDTLFIRFEIPNGGVSGAAGQMSFDLPTGLTADATKVSVNSDRESGFGRGTWDPGTDAKFVYATWTDSNTVRLYKGGDGASHSPLNGGSIQTRPMFFSAGPIPISEWSGSGISVSIQDLTEKTVTVDNTVLDIVTASAGLGSQKATSVTAANAWAESDSNGEYWLHFNLTLGTAVSTELRFLITGISMPAYDQHISVSSAVTAHAFGAYWSNSGGYFIGSLVGNATGNAWTVFGSVKVAAKPAWFDANRENPASVSAFVPEVSSSSAGLVPKISDGTTEPTAGQIGEFAKVTIAGGSAVDINNASPVNIMSFSLTAGDWDITYSPVYIISTGGSSDLWVGRVSTSTTSATHFGDDGNIHYPSLAFTDAFADKVSFGDGHQRFLLTSTTTIYMVGSSTNVANTSATAHGVMTARRMR